MHPCNHRLLWIFRAISIEKKYLLEMSSCKVYWLTFPEKIGMDRDMWKSRGILASCNFALLPN